MGTVADRARLARAAEALLLIAFLAFFGRYAWHASRELVPRGPQESGGILHLDPRAERPKGGRAVTLSAGGEALLLERSRDAARLWSSDKGEWVVFTDDVRRHFRAGP